MSPREVRTTLLLTLSLWIGLSAPILATTSSEGIDTVYFNNGEFGDQIILKSHLTEILEDADGSLTAEELISNPGDHTFNRSQSQYPYNENINSVYWIRFYGKNLDNHGQPYVMDIHSPNVEKLTLYSFDGTKIKDCGSTGLQVPFHDRSYKDKNLLLNLPLPHGSETTTYLIRVEKGAFCRFDFFLTPNNYFMYFSKGEYYFIGAFYGFIFCMLVYNLIMFFALRERVYLYYILVLAAGSLVTLSEDRMGYLWLWNSFPHLSYYLGIHVAPNLVLIFFSIYAISYLQLKGKDVWYTAGASTIHLGFYGLMSLFLGDIAATDSLYFLPFLTILAVAIKERQLKGVKVSANFIAGISFFLLAIIIEELRHQKILFGGTWVVFSFHITLVIQSVILSLSIFDRLKSIRAEKELLNQQAKQKELESTSQQYQNLGQEHIAKELRTLLTLLKTPLESATKENEASLTDNLQQAIQATSHIERFVEGILNGKQNTISEELYTGDIMRMADDAIQGVNSLAVEKNISFLIERDPTSLLCLFNNQTYQSILFNTALLATKLAEPSSSIKAHLKEQNSSLHLTFTFKSDSSSSENPQILTDLIRKTCESVKADFVNKNNNELQLSLPFETLELDEPSESEISESQILMIDSNHRLMEYVGKKLERNIIKTGSGTQALELLQNHSFDLIITEIKDLDLTGHALISQIRNLTTNTSIIVLTGNSSVKEKNEVISLGVEGYMNKPFNIEELKERTSYLLRKQESDVKSAQKNSLIENSIKQATIPEETSFVQQVIQAIEERLDDATFNVDQLAHEVGMSRAQLYRKFKSEVGESAKEFIRNYRLKVAGKLLLETNLSVKEVMTHVGFLNRQYFSKSFKEAHKLSPSAYKQRYTVAQN